MTTTEKIVKVRARAFGGKLENIRCMVDADGAVRVYDSVAGHYTLVHSLSKSAIARIRRLAK
jgi:hypothetical protein